jgi:hypothetical protein
MPTVLLTFCFNISCTSDDIRNNNEDFVSLFNGEDLSGWVIPDGDNGHWRVVGGVIDYDALSEAPGDKHLWTEQEYEDFELRIDWRITDTPFISDRVRLIKPDGTYKLDADGNEIHITMPVSDSGIFLRGITKAQINIWDWPVGSGEVYGFRTDPNMPPEVVTGVTPITMADNDTGEWNAFKIIMMSDRLTVYLNDYKVIDNAQLPDVPERGAIGLQHHGRQVDGEWQNAPSLVQFRNIYIREL